MLWSRRWGVCSLFSEFLAKPQLLGLQLQKANVVDGVMWVPDSQQYHWSNDTVDGIMEAYVDGVSVHGSPKEHMAGGDKLWG